MEAEVTVSPAFNFKLDANAVVKLEKVLAFYRNSHPAVKDAELDQLAQLFKNTLLKVREYDAAMRGLSITSSSAGLKPEVEGPAPAKVEAPDSGPKKTASVPGATAPGFGATPVPGAPPGGFPPPVKKEPKRESVDDMKAALTPPDSGTESPPSTVPTLTTDKAIQGVTPPESKAPRLGVVPGAPEAPTGAPPPAAASAPPEKKPGALPAAGPPGGIPGLPPGGAPIVPQTPAPGSPPPPAASEGAPPPPDEEY